MRTRSKLDQIDDYHYAVSQFIHKGFSAEKVVDLLKKRGVDDEQITSIFSGILKNYNGPRLIEVGKISRALNLIIDVTIIAILCLIFPLPDNDQWFVNLLAPIIILPVFYYTILEWRLGQTIGKLITGTIVINENGKIPGFINIFARTACRYYPVSVISFLFDERTFHDKMSETYVVNKQRWIKKYTLEI